MNEGKIILVRRSHSPSPVREALPQTVGVALPLDQLLPEHPLGDDAGPLLGHGAGVAQGARVQEGEDVLGHVVQTLLGQECDEVPLEHGFEKCIDCAVLVVLHALEQLLHELDLVLKHMTLDTS